jgi:uncharacterized protein DUF4127/beta-N-acetylglucosaminidase-like protein
MQTKKNIAILFSLLLLLLTTLIYANQRPQLRLKSRDYFAGKFLLIPRDERPPSLQQPRMIAAIADHDLITPPARLLGDAEAIIAWAQTVDYDGIDGAIVYLDAVSSQAEAAQGQSQGQRQGQRQRKQQQYDQLDLVKIIRSQCPGIPIYGFIDRRESPNQIDRVIDELGDEKLVDLLTISSQAPSTDEWQKRIEEKIASHRLANRVIFTDEPDSAALSLLTRMLNRRFGFAPRILPAYSSSAGRDAALPGQSLPLHQLAGDLIKKSGGIEVRQNSDGARSTDILLFIHTRQSRDSDRDDLIDAIAQTADKNVRIALVDLSETRESRDAIIANLRRRKLLDRLSAFAAVDPATDTPAEAIARAIAQASSYQAAIRFLRDDLDRVRRIDRAQVALSLSRYLSDWAFPFYIRPKLQSSNVDGIKRGTNIEAAEAFALNQLKPLANELFEDQFKRNAHSYLLSYGERADFEVNLLQRLMVRLYPTSSQSFEIEIKPSIYNFHHGNEIVPQMRTQRSWEILNNELDERVGRRWNAIDWPIFKTDAQSVEISIKIASPSSAHPDILQSYAIVSKRSKDIRRIEITATTPRGAFNAIGKLELMGADGQLNRDFQINETPAYAQRGIIEGSPHWSHRDRVEIMRFLGRIRMNRYFYLQKFDAVVREGEKESSEEKLRELLREADENFVQLTFGLILANSDLDDRNFPSIARELDRLAIIGFRRFVIGFENGREKKTGSDLAQSQLINRIRGHLTRSGNFELEVWPNPVTGADDNRPRVVFNQGEQLCHGPLSGKAAVADGNRYLIPAEDQPQITKLIVAKASEQSWNGSGYDADRAWNSALNLLYDERSRAGVRGWLQHFEDCRKTEKIGDINRELIERRLAELQSALESISGTRERGLLRGELAEFIDRVRESGVQNPVPK